MLCCLRCGFWSFKSAHSDSVPIRIAFGAEIDPVAGNTFETGGVIRLAGYVSIVLFVVRFA